MALTKITGEGVGAVDSLGDAITIDSSNNVGIGTSSPSTLMHLSASSPRITLTDTDTGADHRINADSGAGNLAFDIDVNSDTSSPSAVFNIKGTERMRITSAGNVGINTSSPTHTLDVNGVAKFRVTSAPTWDTNSFLWTQSGFGLNVESYQIKFNSGDSRNERMRIDASGQIMMHKSSLGVTTAGHEFRNTGVAIHSVNNNTCMELVRFGGTGRLQEFYYISTLVGNISTNGTSTSYNTSSDYRLKENVVADWDATTRLKQLNPVRFNFISDADTTVDGFIAHEVQDVVPEAITGTHNEVEVWKDGEELPDGVSVGDNKLDDDGNTIPVYQGIDQSKLVPLLVKTIQELEARITALEAV